MVEEVILVDFNDLEIGTCEKLKAHKNGLMHRAFSVFVFNSQNELLLQRRAKEKYHSSGLWTNTCCGHPRPYEETNVAANRRLYEEMGLKCDLTEIFSFNYYFSFENGLIENEMDHVFTGRFDGFFNVNKEEVMDYKWISFYNLNKDLKQNQENYTYWFRQIYERVF